MLIDELIKRADMLKSIISCIDNRKGKRETPEGSIRCSKHGRIYDYFYCTKDNSRGTYISKNDTGYVKELVQARYDMQVRKAADEELNRIEKMIIMENRQKIVQLYENACPGRKELIKPHVISDEHYAVLWQSEEYKRKAFAEDAPEIFTRKGERVRSKSEKIIADLLCDMGIPYHYEFPLMLEGVGLIYPDFKVLRVKDREVLYVEHLGMMDNPEYASKALLKIESYEKNGIYVGKKLFLTHETKERPINTRILRKKFEEIFF